MRSTGTQIENVVRLVTPPRLTYTVEEAAELLGISRSGAYEAVRAGVIPAERIGRRWVVPRGRLHAWLGEVPLARTA